MSKVEVYTSVKTRPPADLSVQSRLGYTYQLLGLSMLRGASPTDLCDNFSSGTFCRHVTPKDLVSDGNILHMSFSTNDRVVDTGFTATWRAVDPSQGKTGER